jgi:glycosyltransferase involved in cell wall biosynthesis
MRVGIDVSMLVYQGSGVATYTYNLVKNLLKYNDTRYRMVSGKNEYILFYSSLRKPKDFHTIEDLKKLGAQIKICHLPSRSLRIIWNKFNLLPVEWFIGKVDTFFSSDYLRPPLLKGTRGITTIHDLTWKIFPQYHTVDVINAHTRKMQKTIKYKDKIIADSQNTKSDILKYYPQINRNNIKVIYPGVDDNFRKINDNNKIKSILKKYNLEYPSNYLLYIGAIEPRKNLITAIQTFNKLIQDKKYLDFKFLIVGRSGWKNEKVFQTVKNLKLEKKVIFIGYVDDYDLVYFYNASKVFIYLSLYEGFGLPPLEAAKCKVSSLIYSNSSIKETFPSDYPFTKNGEELTKLKYLINNKNSINFDFVNKFNWKEYIKDFLKLTNK